MLDRGTIGAISMLAALCATAVGAQADDAKYPDWRGQWVRAEGSRGVGRFDPTKPPGRLQGAPLTSEYQAIYEANLAEQASGGQGIDPTYRCLSPGMPRIMHAYSIATNQPIWWREDICAENNVHVVVGKEDYFLSADGFLMPIKKDQPPPDLRYFKSVSKP